MSSVPAKLNQEISNTSDTITTNQGGRLPYGRLAFFFALLVFGCGLDLWTKSTLFAWLYDPAGGYQDPHWLVDGIFGFQCSTNPGALFGIGKGFSWLFALFSVAALIGVFVWLLLFRAIYDRWLTTALGLISAGILGNLYDRLGYGWTPGFPESTKTSVRDWIYFRLEGVRFFDPWPNFNIADAVLVTGAIMLFVHALFWADVDAAAKPKETKETKETKESPESQDSGLEEGVGDKAD